MLTPEALEAVYTEVAAAARSEGCTCDVEVGLTLFSPSVVHVNYAHDDTCPLWLRLHAKSN